MLVAPPEYCEFNEPKGNIRHFFCNNVIPGSTGCTFQVNQINNDDVEVLESHKELCQKVHQIGNIASWPAGFSKISLKNLKIVDEENSKIQLKDYLYVKELGKVGFGRVILGALKRTKELAAIKVMPKNQNTTIWNERDILKKVSNCPFVCSIIASFECRNHFYIILEYLNGGTLKNVLKTNKGPFFEEMAKMYIAELICGIQYLHIRNILHRDLKPQNILLNSDGHIKIADFQLAKLFNSSDGFLTQTGCKYLY